MFNGVNTNYVMVLLVTGAVILAAVYHTILYLHRRTKLLALYSTYLWSTFSYCLFRTVYFADDPLVYQYVNPDEILQMISFVMYIRFAAFAMDIDKKKDKYAFYFVRFTPYFITAYLIFNTIVINSDQITDTVYLTVKLTVRAYLLLLGLFMLLIVVRNRQSVFHRYIGAGAGSMIICGIVSSITSAFAPFSFAMGPLSWLMLGYFTDVIFFSAAIGYRIRQEYKEREESLKQLLLKEGELQQKELEKIKAVYETREEERIRIARDLHDDMGSTLSSISIYSKVVSTYLHTDKEKATEFLDKIQNNARQLMEHTTDLIWSLQTNYGEAESIFTRMQKTAVEMLSSANITAQIQMAPAADLPVLHIDAQKNCWLIFKEAVNNVCKYSQASVCSVSVTIDQQHLIIRICDDGIGFKNNKSGNGLKNMRSRAASMEGQCLIESSEKGTTVMAMLPVEKISIPAR